MSRPIRTAALIGLPLLLMACSKPAPQPEPVRTVRTVTVAPASVAERQTFAAEVRARSEVRLGFRVGGKLASRSAEVGQRVKAGEVLARLDPQDLVLSQQAAAAAVQAARVNHELAQADYRRFKDLRDQGFISGAELDRRDATLKAAAAQWEQARAQASVQANQAAYSSLVAGAAGVVVAVEAEPGAVLAAGSPVLRLALDGPRDAVFAVPEDAVAAVRTLVGRPGALGVTPWGAGAGLPAMVREVAAAADPVTRTFLVKADLGASSLQLGQTVTVTMARPSAPAQALLPLSALRELQGRTAVWVVDSGASVVRARFVEVGGAQGNEVAVTAGLQPGDIVVTAGVHVLTDGQAVRLPAAAAPAPAAAASR